MAADNPDIDIDIRDQNSRGLKQRNQEAQASNGALEQPNLFSTPEERSQFEADILGASSGRFATRQQAISDRARSEGRLTSGLTSKEETQLALTTQAEETKILADIAQKEREGAVGFRREQALLKQQSEADMAKQAEVLRLERERIAFEKQKEIGEIPTGADVEGFVASSIIDGDIGTGRINNQLVNDIIGINTHIDIGDDSAGDITKYHNDVIAAVSEALGRLSPEEQQERYGFQLPAETAETLASRRLAGELSINNRLAAVEEGLLGVAEGALAIKQSRLELAKIDQHFNHKVTEAQLTGIWEEYGADEYTAFTDSFGASRGDSNYNVVYDFNSDGDVNLSDFITFSKYATIGGIPTLEMQKFTEDSKQFDLTRADGIQQWDDNFTETVRQFNLNAKQSWELQILSLENQLEIAGLQIDVARMANVVELLSGPAALTLTPEDVNIAIDHILGMVAVKKERTNRYDIDPNAAALLVSRVNNAESIMGTDIFQSVSMSPDVGALSFYTELIQKFPSMTREDQNLALTTFDLDGDGQLTILDLDDYYVMGGD